MSSILNHPSLAKSLASLDKRGWTAQCTPVKDGVARLTLYGSDRKIAAWEIRSMGEAEVSLFAFLQAMHRVHKRFAVPQGSRTVVDTSRDKLGWFDMSQATTFDTRGAAEDFCDFV